MVRHIVLFRIKSFDNKEDKSKKIAFLIDNFRNLREKNLFTDQVYIKNEGENSHAHDLMVMSDFENWKHLNEYIQHEEHKKLIERNKVIEKEKAVIDFEI